MSIGTKTKKTALPSVRPPQEIREKTKERRVWLADECARINAEPNRQAKIVGTGSYQQISVYALTEVEGVIQLRGTCQYCGNQQAVKGGELVLHGYKRPGDGTTYGKCPGARRRPLNHEDALTRQWLAETKSAIVTQKELVQRTATALENAKAAQANGLEDSRNAYHTKPERPSRWAKTSEHVAHENSVRNWRATFPLAAAVDDALNSFSNARAALNQLGAEATHFAQLLASGIQGTPLAEVVT